VLTIAAIGPLAVTGFDDHPAVQAVKGAAEQLGVTQTSATAPAPGTDRVVAGVEVTLAEARALMGLPVTQASLEPNGFSLVVSQYYPPSIAAREGGLYVLTYENQAGSSLNIYQEAGPQPDVAIAGRAALTELDGGRTATYFSGRSRASQDRALTREDAPSQTLLFARGDVGVMIEYSGPHIEPQMLVDVANDMLAQP
jgi:hypothetical protein